MVLDRDINVKSIIWRLIKYATVGTTAYQIGKRTYYNVEGGHRAVEFSRFTGTKNKVYDEGSHLIFPYFEWPTIYDIRAYPSLFDNTSGSRDLQMVKIGLRVLSHPLPDQLPTIHRSLGEDFKDRILPSIVQETLKCVVAQYNASQLITERETVSQDIGKMLRERAAAFHIAIDDVSITNLTFGKEFTDAIEAKQVAAQEAERAKYIVKKAEEDKKSAIIRAQGEAQSALLIGEAIGNNSSFITLRKIEASREIARMVSESKNRVLLNSDELMLNVQEM